MSSIMSLVLMAQVPSPVPGDDMIGWLLSSLKWTVEQFQAKNYVPAVGMVIMVLVFLFNKFAKDKVKPENLPLISAGIGIVSAVATNLMGMAMGSQPMDWLSACLAGLTAGAAASGFWSLLGKKVADKLTPKKD